jgi:hypothetical protein
MLPIELLELVIARLARDAYSFVPTIALPVAAPTAAAAGKVTGKHKGPRRGSVSATKRRAVAVAAETDWLDPSMAML